MSVDGWQFGAGDVTLLINFGHRHDSLLHHRAESFLASFSMVNNFSGGYDDPLSSFDNSACGHQFATLKTRQKIDFVFDGGDLGVWRHHCQSGIAAGNIGQCTHGTAMKTSLLLCHELRIRQSDDAQAGVNPYQARAQVLHQPLTLKARLDALVQIVWCRN